MSMTNDVTGIVRLFDGWKAHFASADRELTWLAAERELGCWLDEHTLLLGKVDAIGRTQGDLFFGEWKTANPRERNSWKQVWRMNPQSLTYGVLAGALYPGCRRFTVRKAFKSEPASYDHAWFSYSEAELEHWRAQLLTVASEIRIYRSVNLRPWPTNYANCFKYGPKYACPFFESACSQQAWGAVPNGAISRVSHLESERRLNVTDPELVVLDATRTKVWFDCRERFHREYEDNLVMPIEAGSALKIGMTFHELCGHYYASLISQ